MNMDQVREELLHIYKRDGELTPRAVLDAARNAGTEMHKWFTWDDNEAAESYRLIQAGKLIRTIRVKVEVLPEQEPKAVRLFHDVSDRGDQRSYKTVADITSSAKLRERALMNARRDLEKVRNTYSDLEELFDIAVSVFKGKAAS